MSSGPQDEESLEEKLDLSSLLDADFGPAWGNESNSGPLGVGSGSNTSHPQKTRRKKGPNQDGLGKHNEKGSGRKPQRRSSKRSTGESFTARIPQKEEKPFHEISFYPSVDAFKAITANLRETGRTHELFELARIILDKPERFLVRTSLPAKAVDAGEVYHVSKMDQYVGLSQEETIDHLIAKCSKQLYKVEEVDAEAPSGNFTTICKCGITGALLGPKNYHRHAEIVREHHTRNLSSISFEKFEAKIENIQDSEVVNEWLEGMKRRRKYGLLRDQGDSPVIFDSLEALRKHLSLHKASELVRMSPKAEFSGRLLSEMPESKLRKDILNALEYQRRFPLETSLAMLGRFRSSGFHHFKKGKKGIAYVSYIKRRRRKPHEKFSPSIESLLGFVEKNPLTEKATLAEKHLNVIVDKQEERERESPEEIKQLARDLRWLVREGYVTEYADGKLETRPPLPSKQPSQTKLAKADGAAKSSAKTSESEEVPLEGLPKSESGNDSPAQPQ